MAEWFPSPALLIITFLVLIFGPRILRRLGYPEKAFSLFKYGWSLLVLAIAVEQSFLHFYLNKKVEQQDKIFYQFIEEAKNLLKWEKSSYLIKCDYRPVFLVYKFEICILQGNLFQGSDKNTKILKIAYPSGLLSYVPPGSGRITWDGVYIFELSPMGLVITDSRTAQKTKE